MLYMARGSKPAYSAVFVKTSMTVNVDTLGGLGRTQTALLRLLLHNKSGLTVDGLAAELGVTRTAVNQHLTSLERDGYVERRDVVATGGRPSRVFALSDRGVNLFPKNYDMFSMKALEALVSALGPKTARNVLERLGEDLGEDLHVALEEKSLDEKSRAIRDSLEQFGFDAHVVETGADEAPEIIAYNCIYHTLARAHPDVCNLDLAFLRTASGVEVDHESCMAKGDNACRFRFRKRRS